MKNLLIASIAALILTACAGNGDKMMDSDGMMKKDDMSHSMDKGMMKDDMGAMKKDDMMMKKDKKMMEKKMMSDGSM